jgi:hypothetical protein
MFKPLQTMSRKAYGWSIVAVFGLSIVLAIASEFYPPLDSFLNSVGTGVAAALAVFTGARLADAGYSRWIGILGVFGIAVVLPVIVTTLILVAFGKINFVYIMIAVAALYFPALIGFLVWAGTRRPVIRVDQVADVFGETRDRNGRERIEPHF